MFLFKKSAISDKVRCLRKEPSAEWSIEVLLLKMGKPSGGGKGGRPSGGGVIDGGKSTQDYVCAVCPAKVKGFHLKNHYKAKTNFVHLAKLKDGEDIHDVDVHTRYMFENGYTKKNLPSYFTHKMVSVVKSGPLDKLLLKGSRSEKANYISVFTLKVLCFFLEF